MAIKEWLDKKDTEYVDEPIEEEPVDEEFDDEDEDLDEEFEEDDSEEENDSEEEDDSIGSGLILPVLIAIVGLGVVLMVGFIVVSQVTEALDLEIESDEEASVEDITNTTQATIFAGFGLVAVGVLVLGAFGLIHMFR